MATKRLKRTDQEWFDLIRDCKTSGLKINIWCQQHSITLKALYYHTQRLRQMGYSIPQRKTEPNPEVKQEIIQLDIPCDISADWVVPSTPVLKTSGTAAIRIDFHGVFLEISNHAEQDIIANTLRALQGLC